MSLEWTREITSAQGRLALMRRLLIGRRTAGASPEAAQAKFQESVSLIPRAPDPHLGLARIYIYSSKNVGKAIAEIP